MIGVPNMSREPRKVLIALGSAALFGAERRFFKILQHLEKLEPHGVEIHLVLNSRLYVLANNVPWISDVLSSLRTRRRLTVIPDHPAQLWKAHGVMRLIALLFRASVVHGVLRGRVVVYIRALIGLPSLFEVTSPEIASRVGRGLPLFFLRRIGFVCVSPSVYGRLKLEITKRFPKVGIEELDLACATIPFFDRSEMTSYATVQKERWIVSASRFLERKNVALFAQSIKDVMPDLAAWKVFILGSGPQEGHIREILSDEIDRDQVYVGYDSKIADILSRSVLYVSLIEPDSYPSQSVLEAMSFNNALLLGDVGDSRKFLGDKMENGMMVRIEREAVSQAIRQAVADFPALVKKGEQSDRVLEEKFGAHLYINELLERYLRKRARR